MASGRRPRWPRTSLVYQTRTRPHKDIGRKTNIMRSGWRCWSYGGTCVPSSRYVCKAVHGQTPVTAGPLGAMSIEANAHAFRHDQSAHAAFSTRTATWRMSTEIIIPSMLHELTTSYIGQEKRLHYDGCGDRKERITAGSIQGSRCCHDWYRTQDGYKIHQLRAVRTSSTDRSRNKLNADQI